MPYPMLLLLVIMNDKYGYLLVGLMNEWVKMYILQNKKRGWEYPMLIPAAGPWALWLSWESYFLGKISAQKGLKEIPQPIVLVKGKLWVNCPAVYLVVGGGAAARRIRGWLPER